MTNGKIPVRVELGRFNVNDQCNTSSLVYVPELLVLHGIGRVWVLGDEPATFVTELSDKCLRQTYRNALLVLRFAHRVDRHRLPGFQLAQKYWWSSHPNVQWVRADLANYLWMAAVVQSASREYKYRYAQQLDDGHSRYLTPPNGIPSHFTTATVPPIFVPDEYQIQPSVIHFRSWQNCVKSFREYYLWEMFNPVSHWTARQVPPWVLDHMKRLGDMS